MGLPVGYDPEICNYDINLLSAAMILSLRFQGVADPFIVFIKLHADDNMVTCLRVKHAESGRKTKRQRDGNINEMQSDALITSVVRLECKS